MPSRAGHLCQSADNADVCLALVYDFLQTSGITCTASLLATETATAPEEFLTRAQLVAALPSLPDNPAASKPLLAALLQPQESPATVLSPVKLQCAVPAADEVSPPSAQIGAFSHTPPFDENQRSLEADSAQPVCYAPPVLSLLAEPLVLPCVHVSQNTPSALWLRACPLALLHCVC